MVNETILEGLKTAIEHGSSLKDAMQSFYNAGYKKEEIEEVAAMFVKKPQEKEKPDVLRKTIKGLYKAGYKKENISKTAEDLAEPQKPKQLTQTTKVDGKTSKNISDYGEDKKKFFTKKKIWIIILITILIILLGALTSLFIFKDKFF